MCMGGGGGSVPAAKIKQYKPQRKRAQKKLNKIVKAINRVTGKEIMSEGINADDTPLLAAQHLLHSSNAALAGVMDQASGLMTAAANSPAMTGQNALQMANLVGPPPPEKNAEKVVVGKARGVETEFDRNRRSLRIDLNTES
jgi:hypothetical protein